MIKFARDFRLIPIVILATIALFVLKVMGLLFDGGYTLGERMRARANPDGITITSRDSIPDYPRIVVAEEPKMPDPQAAIARGQWAPAMFNFGGAQRVKDGDVTGSVDGDKTATLPKIGDKNADNIVTGSSGGGHGASPPPAAGQSPVEPLKECQATRCCRLLNFPGIAPSTCR